MLDHCEGRKRCSVTDITNQGALFKVVTLGSQASIRRRKQPIRIEKIDIIPFCYTDPRQKTWIMQDARHTFCRNNIYPLHPFLWCSCPLWQPDQSIGDGNPRHWLIATTNPFLSLFCCCCCSSFHLSQTLIHYFFPFLASSFSCLSNVWPNKKTLKKDFAIFCNADIIIHECI